MAEGLSEVKAWKVFGAALLRLTGSLRTGLGEGSLRRAGFQKDHLGCNAENKQSEGTPGGKESS